FGDGTTPVTQGPATLTRQYAKAGTYTLKVTVTDTVNPPANATATVTVADAPPVAALSVTPSSGTAPLGVTADASGSSDPDGSIVGPQTAKTAPHTYQKAGSYAVKVTVSDGVNPPASATATVTVADAPPVAALAVTPSSGTAPLGVTADASGSSDPDGSIAS